MSRVPQIKKLPEIVFINPNVSWEMKTDMNEIMKVIDNPKWADTWIDYCLANKIHFELIDCEALDMTPDIVCFHLKNMKPRLICIIVSSRASMIEGKELADIIVEELPKTDTWFVADVVLKSAEAEIEKILKK